MNLDRDTDYNLVKDCDLYNFILLNLPNLSEYKLDKILDEHELNCYALMLKNKFNDNRSIKKLKGILRKEYGLNQS